jgi:hypothetical protein
MVLCQRLFGICKSYFVSRRHTCFIDRNTNLNLCPIALEQSHCYEMAKGKNQKPLLPCTLYGVPYQIEAVCAVADAYQIPL